MNWTIALPCGVPVRKLIWFGPLTVKSPSEAQSNSYLVGEIELETPNWSS